MLREDKENAAGWGISCGVHIIILMIVAATGLFQAVSSESHPVDVEIYDNVTEDEQPAVDGEAAEEQAAAAETAAMEASAMAPIVIDERLKAPEIEKEPKEPREMKEAKDEVKPASDRPANPSATAKPDGNAANGAPGGGDGVGNLSVRFCLLLDGCEEVQDLGEVLLRWLDGAVSVRQQMIDG